MAIMLKPAPLNKYNLNIKDLHDNLENVIKKRYIKPAIKKYVDIYEQSTQPSTSEEEIRDPRKELIRFLIKRNKNDVERLNLKHFKNIKCKDNNNKSCIVPIYKQRNNQNTDINKEKSELFIYTPNKKYILFIRDLYNINYTNILNHLIKRYKLDVREPNILL